MIIPLLLSLFVFADPSYAATPPIVIDSVEIGSPSANDEYIILRNTGTTPVDISKWSIQCRSNGSTTVQKKNFNPDTIIQPQETYRLAHGSGRFAATAQMTYTTLSLVEKGGVIGLFNSTAYAATFEESSLVSSYNYGAPSSTQATAPTTTTTTPITTKAVTTAPEFIGSVSQNSRVWPIRLSELYPNPTTGDEFIELENTSNEGVDVSGLWIKDASGASYALGARGENTVLGAYELRIWPRAQTRIALNNTDGDVILLSDQSNKTVDSIFYSDDALPGNSFARLGNSWLWTTKSTPSAKNYFSAQQVPPYARAEIPNQTLKPNEIFIVSAADSTDLNDTIASYEWDFGDGTLSLGTTQFHSYAATGTFPISLTVTDSFGATSTVSRKVLVSQEDNSPAHSIFVTGFSDSKPTKKVAPSAQLYSGVVEIPPGILGRRRFIMNGRTVEFTTDRKELPLLQRGSVVRFSAREVFKTDRIILQIAARDTITLAALTTAPPLQSFRGAVSSIEKAGFVLATSSTDYMVAGSLRYSNGSRLEVGDQIELKGVLLKDAADRIMIALPSQKNLTLISRIEKETTIPNPMWNIIVLIATVGSFISLHLILTRYGNKYATTHLSEHARRSLNKIRSIPKHITEYIQAR